jgi:PadR family transcriptional regulator, regulatory protein PadR
MTVRREIELTTGRDISIGAVYATLTRLESKDFVKSYAGTPTAERGGRAKRHFRMTADGIAAVRKLHGTIKKMSAGIEGLQGL